MVLSEWRIDGLDIKGVTVMDPWETYGSFIGSAPLVLMACSSYSGLWKEHTSVCYPLMPIFKIVHIAD